MTDNDEQPQGQAPQRVGTVLERLEQWLTSVPFLVLGLLLGLVAFLKSGIEIPGLVTVWDPETWPDPVNVYPHMSYGLRTVGWLVGANSFGAFALISAVAILLALLAITYALRASVIAPANRIALVLVLGGPLVWALFSTFGRPDPLTLAGGVLIGALGRKWLWAVAGALLAILGNADQAVVLSLSLFIATWARPLRAWRWPSLGALAVSVAGSLSLTAWGESAGVPTRGALLDDFWRQSLQQFAAAAPLQVYAGLGLGALVLVWAALDGRWRSAIPLLLGALVLPLVLTATTLDQTRVFIGCSSAAMVAVIVRWSPQINQQLVSRFRYPQATLFLIVLLLPAVEVAGNIVRVPWFSYIPFIQTYLVAPLTGSA